MESNWRKSSYSGDNGGECVEVASAEAVLVRDTTDRNGPVLTFTADAWRSFTALGHTTKGALALESTPLRIHVGRFAKHKRHLLCDSCCLPIARPAGASLPQASAEGKQACIRRRPALRVARAFGS